MSITEFVDERDEWHYFWVGVSVGYTLGLTLGILVRTRS
jgi:ElaB/YqjD/DUF883 family membrane-anchored ribosome-binding protein